MSMQEFLRVHAHQEAWDKVLHLLSEAAIQMVQRSSIGLGIDSRMIRVEGEERLPYLEEVWDMYHQTYISIGLHISSPEELLNYPVWDLLKGEESLLSFSLYKKTPYGLKAGLSGHNGSFGGQKAAVFLLQRIFHLPGVYGEVSHGVQRIVLRSGSPVVCAENAGEILGKPVILTKDPLTYKRPIGDLGLVEKSLAGRPLGITVTDPKNPSCNLKSRTSSEVEDKMMHYASLIAEEDHSLRSQTSRSYQVLRVEGVLRMAFQFDAWDMYEKTYEDIGRHLRSPTDLMKYDIWDVALVKDRPVGIAFYKETPYGLQSTIGVTDGSAMGKKVAIDTLLERYRTDGVYGEVSHTVRDYLLRSDIPVVCAKDVEKVLRKPVIPTGRISYKRRIGSLGWVDKSLVGLPKSIPTTSPSAPHCSLRSSASTEDLDSEDWMSLLSNYLSDA